MEHKILVLTGVSGVGKTTFANLLKEKHGFKSSKSYTTRPMRHNETSEQYYFISKDDFLTKINEGFFLEYTEMFGNYYGTSFESIELLMQDSDVVMTICPKGFLNIKEKWPEKVIGIYLLPPSVSELKRRISRRNSNNEELEIRMKNIYQQSKKDSVLFENKLPSMQIENALHAILDMFFKDFKA